MASLRAIGIFGATWVACGKGAERPRPPVAASQTIVATREGFALRGVAGDGRLVYAAFAGKSEPEMAASPTGKPGSVIEARTGDKVAWTTKLDGTAGELAIAGTQIGVAVAARIEVTIPNSGPAGTAMRLELRGDPAGLLEALDRKTGSVRWQRPIESTEWVILTAVAALGDDFVVGGSFAGTLRIADKVVTSGGGSDGFVARITADGKLGWVVRLGGSGTDAVQGIAATRNRIAIAGTFSLGADLQGAPLDSIDAKSPFGDAFVAELDGTGARRWSATFGSRADDAVAGVAIDARGEVVVAANVREVLSIAGAALVPRGAGDGLVVWYADGGEVGSATLIGGNDFDGLRAITLAGDQVIVAGFFAGTLPLSELSFIAGGSDDSFVAALDGNGTVMTAWQIGGSGREEITSLSAVPGGFVAGIAHTASASVDDTTLAAPPTGTTGAAIVVRGR